MTKPRKPVDRVVKGRTEKQRVTARKYNRFRDVVPLDAANPTRSWWVGLNRTEMKTAAAVNQPRIAISRYGRVNDPKHHG